MQTNQINVQLIMAAKVVRVQRRSQECELGGLPSLAAYLTSPLTPLLTGVRGYNPRKKIEVKGARS